MIRSVLLCFVLTLFIFSSCDDPIYVPKPRGYPKVVYPEKTYQAFDQNYCNFTFEYPDYANIEQDTLFFGKKPKHACWFDVHLHQFDAKIYCSYIPISESDPFDKLRDDAFTMANEHIVKANYIDEIPIKTAKGIEGFAFNLEGPVASPFMFYLSDNTKNYIRGSLYFNTRAEPDSLAPIIDFVKEDILHMINTFEWKD